MKDHEQVESKLILESKRNDEVEVYKLNFLSIFIFLEGNKMKMTSK